MPRRFNLKRFVDAQEDVYEQVLSELGRGQKTGHWMWYIFPQLTGLGRSAMAMRFSISGREEAKAYLNHPSLGSRLKHCTELVLRIDTNSINDVFDYPDDLKFRSCMTLFDVVEPGSVFAAALQKFFGGASDRATLAALKSKA
jgi:uncharacterized protein (DUF1810 family)